MNTSEDGSCRMTDHPNIYDHALTILRKKGFTLLVRPESNEEGADSFSWWAKKGGRNFDAGDPLRLLGMITIWEQYGDDWYHDPKMKTEKIGDQLFTRALPDSPADFENMTEEEFQHIVADYREFFELHMFPAIELKNTITREEMFRIVTTYTSQSRFEDDNE